MAALPAHPQVALAPEKASRLGIPRGGRPFEPVEVVVLVRPADKISALPPYLFAEIDRKIAAKRAEGVVGKAVLERFGIRDIGNFDSHANRLRSRSVPQRFAARLIQRSCISLGL